jgi:hypothetical protein
MNAPRTQVAIYESEAAQTPNAPSERFYASFATHRTDVPFVVTVVARSRQQAKQLASELVRPLGLSHAEID